MKSDSADLELGVLHKPMCKNLIIDFELRHHCTCFISLKFHSNTFFHIFSAKKWLHIVLKTPNHNMQLLKCVERAALQDYKSAICFL